MNSLDRVSDEAFVGLMDLDRPELSAARGLAQRGDFAAAADAILSAIAAHGPRTYVTPDEAAELMALVKADLPDQRRRMELLACRTPSSHKQPIDSAERLRDHQYYDAELAAWRRRGRGMMSLAQLALLTGEDRWVRQAEELLYRLTAPVPLPPGDGPSPLYSWHPGYDARIGSSLDIAHVLQAMTIAAPLLWPRLGRQAKMDYVAYAAAWGERCFRGSRRDQPFNIPLHGLIGALGIATAFPQLRHARSWTDEITAMFQPNGSYVTAPFADPDGYFHENLGYQNVNTMLLTEAMLLLERASGGGRERTKVLRPLVEKAYELHVANLRPDGATFIVGDCMTRAAHEHEQDPHVVLNLGAALFDRPDFRLHAGSISMTDSLAHLPILMGLEGYRRWRQMPAGDVATREHRPAALLHAGILHLKAGRGVAASCHGLLKASVEHNHAHYDWLSVNIFGLGRELVGDSGPHGDGTSLPRAHALCRLAHLTGPGPRIQDERSFTLRSMGVSPGGRIQLAVAEHRLIPQHRQRRALALVMPDGRADAAIWLVWDRVAHLGRPDGQESLAYRPHRFVETLFPFMAPAGVARLGQSEPDGLVRTAWSCHRPEDRLEDFATGVPLDLTCREALAVMEQGSSSANIQVSALAPRRPETLLDVWLDKGQCTQTGLHQRRPVAAFRWSGPMPHEAAYVLLPFAGVADTAPFQVSGWSADANRPGAFEATIRPSNVRITASGLDGQTGDEAVIQVFAADREVDQLRLRL